MLFIDKNTTNKYSIHNGSGGSMYVRNPYDSSLPLPQQYGTAGKTPSQNYLLGLAEDGESSGIICDISSLSITSAQFGKFIIKYKL